MKFPSKDELTQVLVTYIAGEGKVITDLSNQWFTKFLILALRESLFAIVIVIQSVYEQITTLGAKGEILDQRGYESGVDRKQASKAIHSVTILKSAPVYEDTPVPDNFLVTTTTNGNNPPIMFRVKAGQNKKIITGQSSVENVLVECELEGEIGNVPPNSINLIAQAGFDYVTDSKVYSYGTDLEDEEIYRGRILERKRRPGRGGAEDDYKFWAESVQGVVSARVIPLRRGNGTIDIIITGVNGIPDQEVIKRCQVFVDKKAAAGMNDSGILVIGPKPVTIDIGLSQTVWTFGFDLNSGSPYVIENLKKYIEKTSNKDRIIRFLDIITTAKQTFELTDSQKQNPILLDFVMEHPLENRVLAEDEMAVVGEIIVK
ncbi:baseplate J/gp47 family protein [Brevibacillus laterosporus]|uniref:Baseplate J/gp47 family protein n=1 Tax=Brevibacillus laterosporus TaxID=1465 RepID=A0AAP3DEK9_BRELA|nr:baseplate J/gp47 family protein [Brevibacillus laterosporus]MCR8979468.1 baseplate J/gp47 family protein [Brevibacillus laterosporus]MCZ0806623.1 baseplate J/gp47 family protein [Brevibacillus laterosporus]MCZ0825071.1 baseplate J/gp47 family protein [Brevibacillus laterosporus]MCZ0852091.1 baseplate J/gp47 family protein [Brevibacillus laterosporus]